MTKLVTTKNMFNDLNTTTASTSYAVPTWRSCWRYDSENWDGTVEVYFEAVLSHPSGTASCALYTVAGALVTGSEVSTTATTATRVRSSDFFANIVDNGEYTIRIKASTGTMTLYNARLIIKQSGTITKKEYYIPITGGGFGTTSTTLIEQGRSAIARFDPSQWDGTYSVYYEMCAASTNGSITGFSALRDMTAASYLVTISTNATTSTRVRSSAVTMNSGAADYRCYYRGNDGVTTMNVMDAYLVVVQSGAPTKGVFHSALKNMNLTTTSLSNVLLSGSLFYWDDDDWEVTTQTVNYEATMTISNAASTATSEAVGGTSADVTTQSTTKVRVSDTINPDDNQLYGAYLKTSNVSHTATMYAPRFVSYVDFSVAPTFKPRVVFI